MYESLAVPTLLRAGEPLSDAYGGGSNPVSEAFTLIAIYQSELGPNLRAPRVYQESLDESRLHYCFCRTLSVLAGHIALASRQLLEPCAPHIPQTLRDRIWIRAMSTMEEDFHYRMGKYFY